MQEVDKKDFFNRVIAENPNSGNRLEIFSPEVKNKLSGKCRFSYDLDVFS